MRSAKSKNRKDLNPKSLSDAEKKLVDEHPDFKTNFGRGQETVRAILRILQGRVLCEGRKDRDDDDFKAVARYQGSRARQTKK